MARETFLPMTTRLAQRYARRPLRPFRRAAIFADGLLTTPFRTRIRISAIRPGHLPAGRVRSHSRTVLSSLPLASSRPSGLNATPRTAPVWPARVPRCSPLAGSHSRTVLVAAAAGQQPPVRAERHTEDGARVAGQGAAVLAAGRVPQPHRAVAAAAGQQPSVRAERHTEDGAGVAGQGAAVLAAGRVPQPHRRRRRRWPAAARPG